MFAQFYGWGYLALGPDSNGHLFGCNFLDSRVSWESFGPLIVLVAYLEPKLWLQNKIRQKSAPTNADLGYIIPMLGHGHTSQADWVRELFKSSKDSERLLVQNIKENLLLDVHFFVYVYIIRGCLCNFAYIWMTSSSTGSQTYKSICGSKFYWFLGYNTSH